MKNNYAKKDFFSIFGVALSIMLTLVAMMGPTRVMAAGFATLLALTNRTILLTNGPVHINSVTIANSGTNAVFFGLLDAPGSTNAHSANAVAIAQTNMGFTNYSVAIGGISNFFTNILGFLETNFTLGLVRTTNAQAPVYATYNLIGGAFVSSNASVTLPFSALQFSSFGLIVTNVHCPAGTIAVNVDYNTLK